MLAVSLIIPALNEASHITRAVETSFLAGADEVIVVDGGSCDDTAELAQQAGATLLESPPGRARQQNLGAAHAQGDVLVFLHADNWLAADALQQVRGALRSERIQGGAFQQRIEAEGVLYRWLEWGNAERVRWRGIAYGDQAIWMRREVFHRLDGFPETPLLEDLLLMRQFRRLAKPLLLPGPVYVSPRRWQRHGVVRQTLRNWSILLAHGCGATPDQLAAYYQRHE